MKRENLKTGTTTLGVRLPVNLVGNLYLIAGKMNRSMSVIVGDALEEWLKNTEIEDSRNAPEDKPKRKSKALYKV